MMTILVVDDEEDICEMVGDYLEPEGYRVLKAHDGREGLGIAVRVKPDMILLDIAMPRMNGFEMLEHLRGTHGISATPVVMLTAKEQSASILEAERLHAADYLIKPFTGKQLLKVVRLAIG